MDKYAVFDFVPAPDRHALFKLFMEDIRSIEPSNAGIKSLKQFIEYLESKDALSTNFSRHDSSSTYLIGINSTNDDILLDCPYPRGCVVVWQEGSYIKVSGFFSKFHNDKMTPEGYDNSTLVGVSRVEMRLLWSGFLVMVGAFVANSRMYWFATTRNVSSSSTDLCKLAKDIVAPHMTDELVRCMIIKGLLISGQGISPRDPEHGQAGLKDLFLCTCVASGSQWSKVSNLGSKFSSKSGVCTYLNVTDHVEFCVRYSLICETVYIFTDIPFVNTMLTKLLFHRNSMGFKRMETLYDACDRALLLPKYEKITGRADYCETFGEDPVLKGLLLRVYYPNGTFKFIMAKSAKYLWRTEILRAAIKDFTDKHVPFLSKINAERIAKFNARWVVPVDSSHFELASWSALIKLRRAQTDPIFKGKGLHIKLADYMDKKGEWIDPMERETTGTVDVIYVVGPIGCGKSTLARFYCDDHPGLCLLDDNEILKGSRLGPEKGAVMRWAIVECIARGETPVFCTHGESLYNECTKRVELKEYLEAIFPHLEIRTTVVVISHKEKITGNMVQTEGTVVDYARFGNRLEEIYDLPMPFMVKYAKRLIELGGDKGDNANQLLIRSKKGIRHIYEAIILADDLIVVPMDLDNIRATVRHYTTSILPVGWVAPSQEVMLLRQLRVVVTDMDKKDSARHVTIFFSDEGRRVSSYDFYGLSAMVPLELSTSVYTLADITHGKPVGGRVSLAVVRDPMPYVETGHPHITLATGSFKPKDMGFVTQMIRSWEQIGKPDIIVTINEKTLRIAPEVTSVPMVYSKIAVVGL